MSQCVNSLANPLSKCVLSYPVERISWHFNVVIPFTERIMNYLLGTWFKRFMFIVIVMLPKYAIITAFQVNGSDCFFANSPTLLTCTHKWSFMHRKITLTYTYCRWYRALDDKILRPGAVVLVHPTCGPTQPDDIPGMYLTCVRHVVSRIYTNKQTHVTLL